MIPQYEFDASNSSKNKSPVASLFNESDSNSILDVVRFKLFRTRDVKITPFTYNLY